MNDNNLSIEDVEMIISKHISEQITVEQAS
jgi:hypothetical protein